MHFRNTIHELDGEYFHTEYWNFSKLKQETDDWIPPSADEPFLGWSYLEEGLYDEHHNSKEIDNSQFVVALMNDTLIGIISCLFERYDNTKKYSFDFIDVHEAYQNKSVGTSLMNALDQADFLNGSILEISEFQGDGKYAMPKLLNQLNQKQYTLVLPPVE